MREMQSKRLRRGDKQRDRQRNGQRDRQIKRERERGTDRQTDTQTHRHTDTQTHRQTDRESHLFYPLRAFENTQVAKLTIKIQDSPHKAFARSTKPTHM